MTIDQLVLERRQLKSADKLPIIQTLAKDLIVEENAVLPYLKPDHRELRGIFAWNTGDEPAEVTIRRIRDEDWN